MENLNKVYRLLQQVPHGIRAVGLAKKLGINRTGIYDFLNSLKARGKARNEHGLWYPTFPVPSGPEHRGWLGETEFSAEISRIREDRVNNRIERAYRKTRLLVDVAKVSKEWLKENQHLFKSLNVEEQAIAKGPFEGANPDRRRRIIRLKTAIVDEALKYWS